MTDFHITKEFLVEIGFTGFIFGPKKDRDGLERLVWSHFCDDGSNIIVRLVCVNNSWKIDLLKGSGFDSENMINEMIPNQKLEEVIEMVKHLGTTDFKS